MATLPPRKNLTPTRISKQDLSPLQILLQLGFPKHRAEKALAATGHRGVQLASDWLLAHVHDAALDECEPREYILYACPTGAFLKQLEDFWAKSRQQFGWNGAHNFVPHITLVSFFKAPDECALQLSKALRQIVATAGPQIGRALSLDLYTSENFMGFFVKDDDAAFLKRIALQYVQEVSSSTISLEPHVKSLHLTLAYQFVPNEFAPLKVAVEQLDATSASNWELRLYSRDPKLSTKQVHTVLYPHAPQEPDELELRIGDYVYLNGDALDASADGWVEGASWLTGNSGHLPENYTKRTAESDAWTLHESVEIYKSAAAVDATGANVTNGGSATNVKAIAVDEKPAAPVDPGRPVIDVAAVQEYIRRAVLYDLSTSDQHEPAVQRDASAAANANRQLYIMRHGERVDFTFGPWIQHSFDAAGVYKRKDLNMPIGLPARANAPSSWEKDSPLTNMGLHQAWLTGQSLREAGVVFDLVYASPSFRCIQTCSALLEGMGLKDKCPIRIDLGLFEWLIWYQEELPEWCSIAELIAGGYNIDANYQSLYTLDDLMAVRDENLDAFYLRNHDAVHRTLANEPTGNMLIVGHACTVDTCSRHLTGHPEGRSYEDMNRIMGRVPYASLVMVEQQPDTEEWRLAAPACYPLTHHRNARFDWKVMNSR